MGGHIYTLHINQLNFVFIQSSIDLYVVCKCDLPFVSEMLINTEMIYRLLNYPALFKSKMRPLHRARELNIVSLLMLHK